MRYKIGKLIDSNELGKKIVPIVSKIYNSYEEAEKDARKISNHEYVFKLKNAIKDIQRRIDGAYKGIHYSYFSNELENLYAWYSIISFDNRDKMDADYDYFIIYSEEDEKNNCLFKYLENFYEYDDIIKEG